MPTLDHPYADLPAGGRWLRGNLHTHSTRSDGDSPIQMVIDRYAELGYDFLMMSDHDTFADAGYLAGLESHGMVLIPGNEISARGPHMLQVGGSHGVEASHNRQGNIDAAHDAGSMVIANHPNWGAEFKHFPQEWLATLQDYEGIEIYNGVIGRLDGSPYATDRWEQLLNEGRRLWGFANDDCHRLGSEAGLGWNMVYVREPTVAGVVEAMRAGRFYASTGVTIEGIAVEGDRITIETANAQRICALRETSRRFAVVDDRRISVTVPEGAGRVRFECWGAGESFAWTQPFWVTAE